MKFLCDQMLGSLGRWLRTAGYDTRIITQALHDEEILAQALNEKRFLLTRDKQMKVYDLVIILKSNSLGECIQELSQQLPIDWLYHPFSRCLTCNSPLVPPPNDPALLKDVPIDVRSQSLRFCPGCRKLYWEGSHTKRMLKKLQEWSELIQL